MCIQYRCSEEAISAPEGAEGNIPDADVEDDEVEARAVAIRRGIAISL